MKKTFLIFFFLPFFVSAQNLVPNPSFEVFNACPDTFFPPPTGSNISAANGWYNPGGFTPDYLNPCDTNITDPYFGVPLNQYGFQSARTGVAYAGIITSFLYPTPDSIREYIEATLLDSLRIGKSYAVSFHVSLGEWSTYAANDIGAYFSDTLISLPSNPYTLPYIPQIQNNPFNNPLTDTTLWTEVQDTFIAQGGEQYIIIGNFKNDVNTDTTNLDSVGNPNYSPWSYYYIEDVSVICLNCPVGIDDISIDDKIKIYPNPSPDYVQIKTENISVDKIEVINILGEVVFSQSKLPLNNIHSIDFSDKGKGIYLLKINASNGTIYTKSIIIN